MIRKGDNSLSVSHQWKNFPAPKRHSSGASFLLCNISRTRALCRDLDEETLRKSIKARPRSKRVFNRRFFLRRYLLTTRVFEKWLSAYCLSTSGENWLLLPRNWGKKIAVFGRLNIHGSCINMFGCLHIGNYRNCDIKIALRKRSLR